MPPPTIDVLLAVYNGERFLEEFLESLLRQSMHDFNLVVSDNRSTDNTLAILEQYRPRFTHGITILSPPPRTVPAARNFARVTDAAEARYIMYADADDVWHLDKVAKTLAAMQTAEARHGSDAPILVHSDLAVVGRDLEPLDPSYWSYQNIDPSRTRLAKMLLRNCVTGCTMMINHALLDLVRPIPEAAIMHDYWCALNASAFGHIVALGEPLIDYRQHGANSLGASAWGPRFILDRLAGGGIRQSFAAKTAQASAFLARHGASLDPADRQRIEVFAGLLSIGFIGRRWQLVRHGLWEDGLVRNIGLLLAL